VSLQADNPLRHDGARPTPRRLAALHESSHAVYGWRVAIYADEPGKRFGCAWIDDNLFGCVSDEQDRDHGPPTTAELLAKVTGDGALGAMHAGQPDYETAIQRRADMLLAGHVARILATFPNTEGAWAGGADNDFGRVWALAQAYYQCGSGVASAWAEWRMQIVRAAILDPATGLWAAILALAEMIDATGSVSFADALPILKRIKQ